MREAARDFAAQQGDDMPIAGLYVAVRPSGELVSLAQNIEPDHVQPIISELRRIMDEMREFEANHRVIRMALIATMSCLVLAFVDANVWPAIALQP